MTTAANPLGSNIGTLGSILGLFKGTPAQTISSTRTSSGGGSTVQTQMSQEGINALLMSLMENGGSGLAAISSGQKAPGLYNSTSRTLLLNDLLSRSAGEVATKTAPVVTTKQAETVDEKKVTPKVAPMIDPTTGLVLGGAALLGTKSGRKLIDDSYDWIKNELGFGVDEAVKTLGEGQSFMGAGLSGGLGLESAVGGTAAAGSDIWNSAFGSDLGTSFVDTSAYSGMTGLAAGDSVTAGFGLSNALPYAGSFLQALSGDVEGGGKSALGTYAGMALTGGSPIGGAIGAVLADPILDVAGSFTDAIGLTGPGDEGLCFITTAICGIQNKPDDCEELMLLRKYRDTWLSDNYPEAIDQYYNEAPRIVAKLKARDDAPVIFNGLYRHFLVPAIEYIQSEKFQEAFEIYRNMFFVASDLAEENLETTGV